MNTISKKKIPVSLIAHSSNSVYDSEHLYDTVVLLALNTEQTMHSLVDDVDVHDDNDYEWKASANVKIPPGVQTVGKNLFRKALTPTLIQNLNPTSLYHIPAFNIYAPDPHRPMSFSWRKKTKNLRKKKRPLILIRWEKEVSVRNLTVTLVRLVRETLLKSRLMKRKHILRYSTAFNAIKPQKMNPIIIICWNRSVSFP